MIFISYRRQDTGDIAGRIYYDLIAVFGISAVFKDTESLRLSIDFRDGLNQAITTCTVMIVLVGSKWSTITFANNHPKAGQRRLDDPDDWVRREVETALKQPNTHVIPLCIQTMSDNVIPVLVESELPESLRALCYRQGALLRYDPHFRGDLQFLIDRLCEYQTPLIDSTTDSSQPIPLSVRFSAIIYRLQELKNTLRPQLIANIRQKKQISKGHYLGLQTEFEQKQALKTVVVITFVATTTAFLILIGWVTKINPVLCAVLVDLQMVAALEWHRRWRSKGEIPKYKPDPELQTLLLELEDMDELIARYNDEIKRLSELGGG